MEQKLLLIYNPISGKGTIKTYIGDIIDIYSEKDYCITVDVISICGGDGMLHEAVSARMSIPSDKRPPLAYLPTGSTNDFAGTIGIPTDVRRAAKMAVEGSPFFCDAGMLNDKFFAYVAAFGVFTSVSYDTAQEFKNLFGRTAYIVEGIRQLASIKELHLKITFDNGIIEDDFIFGMVTNSLQVGGMKNNLNTAVSLNDGLFEVLLVKKPKNAVGYQNIITAFLTQNIEKTTDIITFKAAKIKFESQEEIPWTVDGEFGGESTSTEITNLAKAFSVIV